MLIRAGARLDLAIKGGKTPLMIAKEKGHAEIVELLSESLKALELYMAAKKV